MQDMLRINYNLKQNKILNEDGKTYVKNNQNIYILEEVYGNIDRLKLVHNIITTHKWKDLFYEIILNNNGNLFTEYKNKKYCLLKIQNVNNDKKIDIINYRIKNTETIYTYEANWLKAWKEKYKYVFSLLHEQQFPNVIIELADYYLGMSKLAIKYLKNTSYMNEYKNGELYITPYRYDKENMQNPLNIVFDKKERFYAELIKYWFFIKNMELYEITDHLNEITENNINIEYIFARLLFPTYFYDVIDKYMSGQSIEEEISRIKKIAPYYEQFLKSLQT